MHVLLVQPPYTILDTEAKSCHPPLGLAYIAASLKDRHEIRVLDAIAEGFYSERPEANGYTTYGLSFEELKEKIKVFNPDVIGISCLFSAQVKNVHKIFALAKELNSKIITIVGGAHPSAMPKEVLGDKNIDYVVMGEGEETARELLERIEKRKDFSGIEGLAYRRDNEIIIRDRNNFENNLDSLPLPAWELFPVERYFSLNRPHGGISKGGSVLPVITSRGCPYRCIFCSIHTIWGRKYRTRKPEAVLNEISYLISKFGVKGLVFDDDNLTFDRERSVNIFRGMIERNFNLSWSLPNGVFIATLDRDLLSLMKKSGCYSISMAVESGDEEILKQIKKPVDLIKAKKIIKSAQDLGLEIAVFFVVGFPFETKKQVEKTLHFARELKVDNVNIFYATPLPGSELFELCVNNNLLPNDLDFSILRQNLPSLEPKDFSKEELQSLVEKEKIRLYFYSIFRNPIKLFFKAKRKILKEPEYFFKFIRKCFKYG
ncbi:MAG: cobalamin-dependent protein [Candidatus Omnitrophica bacterium]|nr:cobalamin-dependent protein [Candidatus Omnitrophota bacterium]